MGASGLGCNLFGFFILLYSLRTLTYYYNNDYLKEILHMFIFILSVFIIEFNAILNLMELS